MRIQINSDRSIRVDARVREFVEEAAERVLAHAAGRLTRIEVHLSDVNSRKAGPADKSCVVEARPSGAKPLTTSAIADTLPGAVNRALRKMQRSLNSFVGRQGTERRATAAGQAKPTAAVTTTTAPAKARKPAAVSSTSTRSANNASTRASAPKPGPQPSGGTVATGRGPKKKGVFLARRKAWPSR